jgi:hypothetical protein
MCKNEYRIVEPTAVDELDPSDAQFARHGVMRYKASIRVLFAQTHVILLDGLQRVNLHRERGRIRPLQGLEFTALHSVQPLITSFSVEHHEALVQLHLSKTTSELAPKSGLGVISGPLEDEAGVKLGTLAVEGGGYTVDQRAHQNGLAMACAPQHAHCESLLFLFGTLEDRCKHFPHVRRQRFGQGLHCREPSLVRACVRVHHVFLALLALGRRSHGGPLLPIAFWVEPP